MAKQVQVTKQIRPRPRPTGEPDDYRSPSGKKLPY